MKKIIEYDACYYGTGSQEGLEAQVNRKIEQGFQPYGFPCVAAATAEDEDKHKHSDFVVVQAMVKYED